MQHKNEKVVVKNNVILNSFQDLHRLFSTRGFTLIELLVVVLIIGILAAVAVPQYQKAVDASRLATIKDLAKSIGYAQRLYFLENGSYAKNLADLTISLPGCQLSATECTYPWGYCYLSGDPLGSSGGCLLLLKKDSDDYVIFYDYSNTWQGNYLCLAREGSQRAYRLCQRDTGKSTPFETYTGYHRFEY